TDEFGTKVGLLAGLIILCAARPLVDRLVPEPRSAADDLRRFFGRASAGTPASRLARRGARAAVALVMVVVAAGGIVLAGAPARGGVAADTTELLTRLPTPVDPATLPTITVDPTVADFHHQLAGPRMQDAVASR